MKCWYCGSTLSKVIDKREVQTTGEIRRRRECLKCHKRYTTYERAAGVELVVIKRDGRKEPFNAEKIRNGLLRALEKRPGLTQINEIVGRVEGKVRAKGESQVASKFIGQTILTELKKLDQIAYLRFASVYRGFQSAGDFTKELETLEKISKQHAQNQI